MIKKVTISVTFFVIYGIKDENKSSKVYHKKEKSIEKRKKK